MVLLLLVAMPLSEGYDFIGKPNHKRHRSIKDAPVPKVAESVKEEPKEPEPVVEEVQTPVAKEPEPVAVVLPEPTIIPEEPKDYIEVDYETLVDNNELSNVIESVSGNYIVVYGTNPCEYCDKLVEGLRGNVGDYVIVVIKCKGSCRDLYYSRWVTYFPSFLVIKNNKVRYYGYGYRTLEEFKRLL